MVILTLFLFGYSQAGAAQKKDYSEAVLQPSEKFLDYHPFLGSPDAPVEMVEIIDFSCSHCRAFYQNILPKIKKKYIDTGKVKLSVRTVAQNVLSLEATILSRCAPSDKYFKLVRLLLEDQDQWINRKKIEKLSKLYGQSSALRMYRGSLPSLLSKTAKKIGMGVGEVKKCLKRNLVRDYVLSMISEIQKKYKANSTPMVFIAGKRIISPSYEELEKLIEAALVKHQIYNIK